MLLLQKLRILYNTIILYFPRIKEIDLLHV